MTSEDDDRRRAGSIRAAVEIISTAVCVGGGIILAAVFVSFGGLWMLAVPIVVFGGVFLSGDPTRRLNWRVAERIERWPRFLQKAFVGAAIVVGIIGLLSFLYMAADTL
jgi:hypothetical protein